MPGQHSAHQHIWLVECEPKPKEVINFGKADQDQARALSGIDEPLDDYYWIWTDDSEKCFLNI